MKSLEGEFKLRYNNNNQPFKNWENNKTELSKYIWQLKENLIALNLEWEIAAYTSPFRCGTRLHVISV